ncbi:PAP2-domain-containing protein [Nadsonia fulvescens var. elongata DSM 6958]|uniref:PAP2-domain-containing protein n=1 Tax=Nadsonia fulvescens var. elongata DSM 6958 TaxID=857566 RepID=A0A1E3PLH2_9ASCO|nr:PAP2-domain-containing protein [Nadsonia fulvescens var. elongata DSM 6958]
MLMRQHAIEWLSVLGMLCLAAVSETFTPFFREFSLSDITIQHPFTEVEMIPNQLCLIIAVFFPAIVIAIYIALISVNKNRLKLMEISLLGLFISVGFNIFVTNVFKVWIGRPRPDFLARCIPAEGTPLDRYVSVKVCTGFKSRVIEGFKSTPSGHSSTSFSGLLYLSFFLVGQLRTTWPGVEIYKSFIAFVPTLIAFLIALSRTEDYRHHFIDVILGSILGSMIAWFSYRKYFPSVLDTKSDLPYDIDSETVDIHLDNRNPSPGLLV